MKEAYDMLPFYATLGVPEVWIIDRDSKEVDLFVLESGRYGERPQAPTAGS